MFWKDKDKQTIFYAKDEQEFQKWFSRKMSDILQDIETGKIKEYTDKDMYKAINEYKWNDVFVAGMFGSDNVSEKYKMELLSKWHGKRTSGNEKLILGFLLKSNNLSKENMIRVMKMLGFNTIEEKLKQLYIQNERYPKEKVKDAHISESFVQCCLEEKEVCEKTHYLAFLSCSNDAMINRTLNKYPEYEENELVNSHIISNNTISDNTRNDAFNRGYNPKYIYHTTKHIGEEMYRGLAETVFQVEDKEEFNDAYQFALSKLKDLIRRDCLTREQCIDLAEGLYFHKPENDAQKKMYFDFIDDISLSNMDSEAFGILLNIRGLKQQTKNFIYSNRAFRSEQAEKEILKITDEWIPKAEKRMPIPSDVICSVYKLIENREVSSDAIKRIMLLRNNSLITASPLMNISDKENVKKYFDMNPLLKSLSSLAEFIYDKENGFSENRQRQLRNIVLYHMDRNSSVPFHTIISDNIRMQDYYLTEEEMGIFHKKMEDIKNSIEIKNVPKSRFDRDESYDTKQFLDILEKTVERNSNAVRSTEVINQITGKNLVYYDYENRSAYISPKDLLNINKEQWKNILNQSKTNSDIQNLLSCINNIVNEHIFFTEGKVMFCSHLDDLENKLQMAFDRRNEIQKEIQERNMEEER